MPICLINIIEKKNIDRIVSLRKSFDIAFNNINIK